MLTEKSEAAPGEKGGSHKVLGTRQQSTEWPRTVREICDDLVDLAREAWNAGRVVDPHRLAYLADELAWAAATSRLYGGDPAATERFEAAVRETAELAALTRQAVAA